MEVKKVTIDGKDIEFVSKMEADEYEDKINDFDDEDTLDLEELNKVKEAMLDKTIEFSSGVLDGE